MEVGSIDLFKNLSIFSNLTYAILQCDKNIAFSKNNWYNFVQAVKSFEFGQTTTIEISRFRFDEFIEIDEFVNRLLVLQTLQGYLL